MTRVRPFLAAFAVLAVLSLIVRQVSQAVKHTFAPRAGLAQLDPASPKTQNGLTLETIQNVNLENNYSYSEEGLTLISLSRPEDETGLWVSLSNVPNGMVSPCAENTVVANIPCDQFFSVTGRSSTGSVFPLSWKYINDVGNHLLVTLPPGYPNTYRWVDVTVDDHHGGKAVWRITHLPPMPHVLAPPVIAQTIFHQGTITAHAAAYRGPDPNGNLKGQVLLCDVTGTVKPSPHQWELGPLTLTREWEAPGYIAPSGGSSYGTEKKNGATRFEATGQVVYFRQAQPYLTDTHWVRLTARMQEFETYDETVVFHNLSVIKTPTGNRFLVGPKPETIISPSGITATLIDPRPDRDAHNRDAVDTAALMIDLSSSALASLPHSPLWRQFRGVVMLSCAVPSPYEDYGFSGNGSEGMYRFHSDTPLPKVIANFPIIIRQRVNLRSVPMTLTLPILDKKPAGYP